MMLWLANLTAYSVQLAALVVSAAIVVAVLRIRAPRASMCLWQLVFATAIALPFLQPWEYLGQATTIARFDTSPVFAARAVADAPTALWPVVGAGLILGACARLGWLAVGLIRLNRLGARAVPPVAVPPFIMALQAKLGTRAAVRLSAEVPGPVTFGLRRPTVLLPPRTLQLPVSVQQAVVCHELLHVRRRDWLRTLCDECWCAVLWFHPAARLLASRLSLARETIVDSETIAHTHDRRAYVEALLTFAAPSPHPPVPATPFFGRRHLSQRISLIAKESPMRPVRTATLLGTATAVVAGIVAFTVSQAPLASASVSPKLLPPRLHSISWTRAAPEPVRPGNGVTVPVVVHNENPAYTAAALKARIQGSVKLDVVVLESGQVGKVDVVESLDAVHGLDEAAVEAATRWTFEAGTNDGKPVPVIVTLEMTFTLKD